MTMQTIEVREERQENRLTTADLAGTANTANTPLFAQGEAQDFRQRWGNIQSAFVDEPKASVQQADELVASAIKRLAEVFAEERQKLEADWGKAETVSTEDLRVALRKYRSFFDRILSV